MQNTVKELWSLLNFLHPDRYPSLEEFEDAYQHIRDASDSAAQKVQELQSKLKPHLLRRMKKDVETSLPQKNEYILRVGLSPSQLDVYKNLHCRNFDELRRGGSQVSLLNLVIELKKCSNHPYLFDGYEKIAYDPQEQVNGIIRNSGKMYLLDKLLDYLKKNGHRVLIFSQMVRMLDILNDYLRFRGYPFQRLDGSTGNEARKKAIERFNATGSQDFVFLLSTRAGGLGINLDTADTVIIYDSDWNPQNDLQAMARAHRIGQKNVVNIYRLIAKDTIEEQIFERAKAKMVLEHAIIGNLDATGAQKQSKSSVGKLGVDKEELDKILKFGASNLFKKQGDEKEKELQSLEKMDITEFLKNAEKQEETTELSANDAFLNQFKVADFGGWEEVIPESERGAFETEEKKKNEEELGFRRKAAIQSYRGLFDNDGEKEKENPRVRRPGAGRRRKMGSRTEMTDRDIKSLYKSLTKFGDVQKRFDEILQDAELQDKEKKLVKDVAERLVNDCRAACDEIRGKNVRANKSVSITFDSTEGINASSLIQRIDELQFLSERLNSSTLSDMTRFRFTTALKPVAKWSVDWGAKHDAMLVVGIHRHGFGNWAAIEADPDLDLAGKFFLNTTKNEDEASKKNDQAPKVVHLLRRAEYLLRIIRDEHEQMTRRRVKSKAPATKRKTGKQRATDIKSESKAPLKKRKVSDDQGSKSNTQSITSPIETKTNKFEKMMDPVREDLDRLNGAKDKEIQQALPAIKQSVVPIGDHIQQLLDASSDGRDDLEERLWRVVKKYWPIKNVQVEQIRKVCNRVGYYDLILGL